MTSQQPPATSKPSTLKPRTFRIILAVVFLVGSILPVLRGCNATYNSFDVVFILTGRFPEDVLGWLLIGSTLFLVSLVAITLYTFSRNETKRPLFNKTWAYALSGYVLVVLVFVLQNQRMFDLELGWIVLTVTAIVGLAPSFVMKLLRVQSEDDTTEGQNSLEQFPTFPFSQGSAIHNPGLTGPSFSPTLPAAPPPAPVVIPPPPFPGAPAPTQTPLPPPPNTGG